MNRINAFTAGEIVIAMVFGLVVGGAIGYGSKSAGVALDNQAWYCSDARVDSLELPLVVECYEYKRKGVKDEQSK